MKGMRKVVMIFGRELEKREHCTKWLMTGG